MSVITPNKILAEINRPLKKKSERIDFFYKNFIPSELEKNIKNYNLNNYECYEFNRPFL